MKILLVGNGGREHAIASALKKSPQCTELICFASRNNPGISRLCSKYEIGNMLDFEHLKKFASQEKPDFAFVGPDDPIALGAADELESIGINSVAPKKSLARLESSKSFTRELLTKYNLEHFSPQYAVVKNRTSAQEFIKNLNDQFVIKMDGLCGGKGVKVMGDHFQTPEEGLKIIEEWLPEGKVVLEEKLVGQEFSLMSFVDGQTVADMPAVQDHKRAYDGDQGPNTGGMGSYSYADILPFLKPEDLATAHQITIDVMQALKKECEADYKGIMYGGFIVTEKGVKLIEYNARFGDPECLNILPILETDFVDICQGIINKTLDQIDVKFASQATVCKYVVPEGYPVNPKKGEKIKVKDIPPGVKMYYSSVDEKDGELYLSSSRAIAFVGIANDINEAEKLASSALASVTGPVFYRKDIGTKDLIQKRINMMNELRR